MWQETVVLSENSESTILVWTQSKVLNGSIRLHSSLGVQCAKGWKVLTDKPTNFNGKTTKP